MRPLIVLLALVTLGYVAAGFVPGMVVWAWFLGWMPLLGLWWLLVWLWENGERRQVERRLRRLNPQRPLCHKCHQRLMSGSR